MKKMMNWVLAATLCICGITLSAACSNNDNPSDSSEKELRIAIAWRADTDNEFCTNIVEAFREAGVAVTVLPQVKAGYLDYDGSVLSTACIDAEGIGYLSNASGALIRSKLYNANASQFMTRDAAMPLFRAFIGECKK